MFHVEFKYEHLALLVFVLWRSGVHFISCRFLTASILYWKCLLIDLREWRLLVIAGTHEFRSNAEYRTGAGRRIDVTRKNVENVRCDPNGIRTILFSVSL